MVHKDDAQSSVFTHVMATRTFIFCEQSTHTHQTRAICSTLCLEKNGPLKQVGITFVIMDYFMTYFSTISSIVSRV